MKLAAVNPRLDFNIEGLLSKDVCYISQKLIVAHDDVCNISQKFIVARDDS